MRPAVAIGLVVLSMIICASAVALASRGNGGGDVWTARPGLSAPRWDLACQTRPPRMFERYMRARLGLRTVRVLGPDALKRAAANAVGTKGRQVVVRDEGRWTDALMARTLRASTGGGEAGGEVLIITAANDWSKAEPLLDTAREHGYRVVKRQIADTFVGNNGGSPSSSWAQRLEQYHLALRKCRPLDIIVLSDAWDVMVQADAATLRRRFLQRDRPIMLGLEKNPFPANGPGEAEALRRLYTRVGLGGVRFTCAGLIVGRAWALLQWLTELKRNGWACDSVGADAAMPKTDDQRCTHRLFMEHGECVYLDTTVEFVWNIGGFRIEEAQRRGDKWRLAGSPRWPVFLHGNGGRGHAPVYWQNMLQAWQQRRQGSLSAASAAPT